ncbi:MAG: hypothetical protein ACI857_002622 [Arenicella sp.]|jgi:hypothetical protein
MKKLLVLAIALTVTVSLNAQDWSPESYKVGTVYEGHIIMKDGKKVAGFIEANIRTKMQSKITYWSVKGDKGTKETLTVKEITSFTIAGKTWKAIAYSGGISKKALNFNLHVKDGAIEEYVYYSKYTPSTDPKVKSTPPASDYQGRKYESKNIYKNGDVILAGDQLVIGFKKKMPLLVSDNSDMVTKIQAKEPGYKVTNRSKIIEEYNNWKSSK